mmetsp:Transcript_17476/g.48728  ORF Transcript_17476/g.48728 Transcript_17476/m.48728 type:complete len:1074 (+) Transcript_17476:4072-7293(+)
MYDRVVSARQLTDPTGSMFSPSDMPTLGLTAQVDSEVEMLLDERLGYDVAPALVHSSCFHDFTRESGTSWDAGVTRFALRIFRLEVPSNQSSPDNAASKLRLRRQHVGDARPTSQVVRGLMLRSQFRETMFHCNPPYGFRETLQPPCRYLPHRLAVHDPEFRNILPVCVQFRGERLPGWAAEMMSAVAGSEAKAGTNAWPAECETHFSKKFNMISRETEYSSIISTSLGESMLPVTTLLWAREAFYGPLVKYLSATLLLLIPDRSMLAITRLTFRFQGAGSIVGLFEVPIPGVVGSAEAVVWHLSALQASGCFLLLGLVGFHCWLVCSQWATTMKGPNLLRHGSAWQTARATAMDKDLWIMLLQVSAAITWVTHIILMRGVLGLKVTAQGSNGGSGNSAHYSPTPPEVQELQQLAFAVASAQRLHSILVMYGVLQAAAVALMMARTFQALSIFQGPFAVIMLALRAATPDLMHLFIVCLLVILLYGSAAVMLAGSRVERLSSLQSAMTYIAEFIACGEPNGLNKDLWGQNAELLPIERVAVALLYFAIMGLTMFLLLRISIVIVQDSFFQFKRRSPVPLSKSPAALIGITSNVAYSNRRRALQAIACLAAAVAPKDQPQPEAGDMALSADAEESALRKGLLVLAEKMLSGAGVQQGGGGRNWQEPRRRVEGVASASNGGYRSANTSVLPGMASELAGISQSPGASDNTRQSDILPMAIALELALISFSAPRHELFDLGNLEERCESAPTHQAHHRPHDRSALQRRRQRQAPGSTTGVGPFDPQHPRQHRPALVMDRERLTSFEGIITAARSAYSEVLFNPAWSWFQQVQIAESSPPFKNASWRPLSLSQGRSEANLSSQKNEKPGGVNQHELSSAQESHTQIVAASLRRLLGEHRSLTASLRCQETESSVESNSGQGRQREHSGVRAVAAGQFIPPSYLMSIQQAVAWHQEAAKQSESWELELQELVQDVEKLMADLSSPASRSTGNIPASRSLNLTPEPRAAALWLSGIPLDPGHEVVEEGSLPNRSPSALAPPAGEWILAIPESPPSDSSSASDDTLDDSSDCASLSEWLP